MRNARSLVALACLAAAWAQPSRAQEEEEGQGAAQERTEQHPKKRRPPEKKPSGDELPAWAERWPETFRAAQQGGVLRMASRVTPSALPAGSSEVFAVVTVRAPIYPVERDAPLNLALVLDKSESMKGARLVAARRAARELIDQLDERDRLAIIAVSDDTEVLPSEQATP